ncbi:MAG: V-type ATP synthase subunit F [Clostridia bacterium]|nr:V-type ATP synthase subunit F [Clostridia bacterium]
MKSYLLTNNKDTLVGLRLAGVHGQLVHTAEELHASVQEKMSDKETGIIIISTDVVDYDRVMVMEAKLKSDDTLIIEIPSGQKMFDSDYITRYIKESIGVKL